MKIRSIITLLLISFAVTTYSQENNAHATFFTSSGVTIVPSIASKIANGTFIESKNERKEVNPKRAGANKTVPGKGLPHGIDPLLARQAEATKNPTRDPLQGWPGLTGGNSTPTDPTGAVGPNHFINAWNSSFRIWDKEGNALTSNASLSTIFTGQSLGDPIVFYDQFADRFVITQFRDGPPGFLVAVCQGSDPVNDGWYTYQFITNSFPDYPKFSLWSDGYYITANKNTGSAGSSEVVFALDRASMLTGNTAEMVGFPLPGISTSGFYSPLGFNANGTTPPPAGNAPIVYMQDDAWGGVAVDHLKIWNINVDWDNTSASTISAPQTINTAPFDGVFDGGAFSNISQPSGPDIDCLQATIMYMAQYRRFSTHNSVVLNFAVDLDGNDERAGIRWYELRQQNDGDDWTIYQEGTYSQPEGHSAFSGTIAIDINGNIGLGYTVASASQAPCLRYTGRYVSDPLNTMTLEEGVFINSNQSDPSTRYGDYSQLTVDPADEKTFWYVGEYFTSSGSGRNNWIGAFKIAADLANDVGVLSIDSPTNGLLGNSEAVTITVRNFGIETQSNFDVSYSINGGALVTETFTGTLATNETAQYTFTSTADLSTDGATYTIFATTNLATDGNDANDPITIDVTDLPANDIGASEVTAPASGSGLGASEPVTVTIQNFGGAPQSNFTVTYSVDGGAEITETVNQTVQPLQSISHTFGTNADVSTLGLHTINTYTSLDNDADASNNATTTEVINQMCQPDLNCGDGDGFYNITLGDINNDSDCSQNGYASYMDQSTSLASGQTHTFTATTHYGSQYVKVWIDFNDNFVFENSEVVAEYIIAESQNEGVYTESTDLSIADGANIGEHLLRAKSNWNEPVPNDPCEETTYGETEDYTVYIDTDSYVGETSIKDNELVMETLGNNIFNFSMTSSSTNEVLILTVHNTVGQTIVRNRVYSKNNTFEYLLDMSYASPGVYLVRLGNDQGGKIQRIVIK